MVLMCTMRVAAQHLDNPAVLNRTTGALLQHPLQLGLQRVQP